VLVGILPAILISTFNGSLMEIVRAISGG